MKKRAVFVCGFAAMVGLMELLFAAGGPPPYLTMPLLERYRIPNIAEDRGHRIFSKESPGPHALDLGTAPYVSVPPSGLGVAAGIERNVSMSSDAYEGETTGTAAGAFGTVLIAGSNRVYPDACNDLAAPGTFGDCAPLAYGSTDGGATWSKTSLPRIWNGVRFGIGFDPAIDVAKNGTMYYSYIVAPLASNYPNAIVMVKWLAGVGAKLMPVTWNTGQNFDDKQYIAVDRSAGPFANRIYVTWDRNRNLNQILLMSYSADGGATWSTPVKVNDGTTPFERVIGAYPAVDHQTGVVYNSWHDYAKNRIFVDRSSTGGASWGVDVAAATTHTGFGMDIGCVGGRAQGPSHALRVGPSGTLYLVYADQVAGRGFDILLTRSTDGGATWSTPATLNDDATPVHQFQPTLSVEPAGSSDKVTVTFYDRRDDIAANCLTHVYATQSVDGGLTWSANVRQTTLASNFNGNPNGPGDYSSSVPFAGAVWPFFADHRPTNVETAPGGGFDVYTVDVR